MPPMRLVEKPKNFKGTLKQLTTYVRPYYGRIVLSLILMITSTVMCIYGPRLIGNVTTLLSQGILAKYKGEGGIDFVKIGELISFILLIYSISALIDYVVNILHTLVAVDISYRLREDISKKILDSVNEGARVNEDENKRRRNIMIIAFSVICIIATALIWLIVLMIARYAGSSSPVSGRDPAAEEPGMVQPAEEPVSRTVRIEESELDALIVPETPSISVLKMSKSPGVRDSL